MCLILKLRRGVLAESYPRCVMGLGVCSFVVWTIDVSVSGARMEGLSGPAQSDTKETGNWFLVGDILKIIMFNPYWA